ncbi:TlyA family RNA methyltransferase [Rhodoblastus sp.]|uniref:TlyA family RNA methyltransferase n=1 Tax=Rhodoblastus sp. TaxID=1962975 RepID=UPI003F9C08F3
MSARRADIALVERGFFASRAKAREAIEAGLVTLDGRPVEKPAEPVGEDAILVATAPYPWVSRGGVKLAAALDAFAFDPAGKSALDIGASTGGFTHVLLSRGAAHVTCVDVGHGQLHPLIASDKRVKSQEKCDARELRADDLAEPPQLIVGDVSFISLALILPAILPLAAEKAEAVLLVKPQFEAGPEFVRKGLVRDSQARQAACEKIAGLVKGLGWEIVGLIDSPIQGGDGNREFLLGARRT